MLLFALLPLPQDAKTQGGFPPPEKVRAMINFGCFATKGAKEAVGKVEDATIPLKGRTLKIRVYTPEVKAGAPNVLPPVTVFFHGGGFIAGNLETHDRVCRALCQRARTAIFAVEYRLAPEHPFPAAFDDAAESVRWIAREATRFGGDASRMAVVGDSGGATLAAAVALGARGPKNSALKPYDPKALRAAPKRGVRIVFQALVDPALDPARYDAKGFEEYAYFRAALFPTSRSWTDPRVAFLRTKDLRGVAPALIVAGEEDALLAEAREYVERLRAAKVPVEFWIQPKQGHLGPLFAANAAEAQEPIDRVANALRQAFGPVLSFR